MTPSVLVFWCLRAESCGLALAEWCEYENRTICFEKTIDPEIWRGFSRYVTIESRV